MTDAGLIMKRTETGVLADAITQLEMRSEIKELIHDSHDVTVGIKKFEKLIEKLHDIQKAQEVQKDIDAAALKSAKKARKLYTNEAIYWRIMAIHLHQLSQELETMTSKKNYLSDKSFLEVKKLKHKIAKVREDFKSHLDTARKTINGLHAAVQGRWDTAQTLTNLMKSDAGLFMYWQMRREGKHEIKDTNNFLDETERFRDVYDFAMTGKAKRKAKKDIMPGQIHKLCNKIYDASNDFTRNFFYLFLNSSLLFKRIIVAIHKENKDMEHYIQEHLVPMMMYRASEQQKVIIREEVNQAIQRVYKEINQIEGQLG